jgi:hypothetical protein
VQQVESLGDGPDPYRNPLPEEPQQTPIATDQHRGHCGERQIDTRVPVATVRMMPLRQQSIPIRAGSNSAQVVPVKKAETQDKRGASGEPERPRRGSINYLRLVMAMIPAPGRDPHCRRESDNR